MITSNENKSEDISLKEIVLRFRDWSNYILKYWLKIALFGFLGGCFGFIYAHYQKPTYLAKTTIVLDESNGSSPSLGGLASLAGQFGVDVGGSGGGLLSGDNILLFFKSINLAREVLLSSYDGVSNKTIADEYSSVYGLKESWLKDKKIGNIQFPILNSKSVYSRLQDSLLLNMIYSINKSQFTVNKTDKKAGFIDISIQMQSETLAKVYCERIVEKVIERYINIKTQKQNATVKKLQLRVDSIANLLKEKTISGASLQNNSSTMDINPLYKTGTSVAVESTLRDKTLLATIFASVTQNLEIAKFTLSQETPVIQIVDEPLLPLKKEKKSRLISALIGSFIISSIFIFWLISKRIYSSLI